MHRIRGDVHDISLPDGSGLARVFGLPLPCQHHDFVFIVMAVKGRVATRFDQEGSHREVWHAVFGTQEHPHRDVLDAVHPHG